MRPIVVPVLPSYLDPERVTHCAIPYGRALAQRLHTQLALLSVVEVTESLRSYLEAEGEQVGQLLQRWLTQREEALRRLARSIDATRCEVAVRLGEPAKEIIAFADEVDAAAIVMSSHGRVGVTRLLVGSTTFSVIQRAHQPTLVVRARVPVPPPNAEVSFSPVLVPLDGSPLAEEAIDVVLNLLAQTGDTLRLHLLHVLTDNDPAHWETYLRTVAARISQEGISVTWNIAPSGSVPERIAAEAQALQAGLIAMGTHGLSGIRRVLLGSTAEHVLHATTAPLLLYRPAAVQHALREQPARARGLSVRDIMTPNPITVDPDTNLEEVARLMLEHQIGAVPVVDREGNFLGLIREEDFLAQERPIPFAAFRAPQLFGHWVGDQGIEQIYAHARMLTARKVAREPELVVDAETTLDELARQMVEHNVRHVPVLREGKLVGIVTRHDVLKAVARGPAPTTPR